MGRYLIKKRDGLARSGTCTHGDFALELPAALDMEGMFPSLREVRHANVPLHAERDFVERYHLRGGSPAFIHPHSCEGMESGTFVAVPNWHTALRHPRMYVDWLLHMKGTVPPDTIWYAPTSANPSNAALLIYSGFDLFDFKCVDLATSKGLFCIPDGCFPKEWMESGICTCRGCESGDLSLHNRIALVCEINLAKRMMERSQLREHLEVRCRASADQVAVMRFLDMAYSCVERYTPIARSSVLKANSGDALNRPEVKRFAERVIERFIAPSWNTAVLLPCSARKPYSTSQSHRKFRGVIRRRAHELIVTSPLGLVPRELEGLYPASHYDVPVTGIWDREELHFVSRVISRYLASHPYQRVIAHLEGGALQAARMAAGACGIELEESCRTSPQSAESLERLEDLLDGETPMKRDHTVQGIISWQFDTRLDMDGMSIRRKGLYREVWRKGKRLFGFSRDTGLLVPTFEGWALLGEGYRVRIDDFVPKGDVFAAGVRDADERIREGDEVLVTGPLALATGRAAMCADEMRRSRHGLAVHVRKVLKYG
ncbi:MAG: archaeosine synthase subunit alpha [Methanomicrobiales archaeon]|nr:archaeosine synthase subunit alpha [Methanomicrobiales archaeon]